MPSSALIETFGGALKLDPRFFQWSTKSNSHVFTPSQRHRAPYLTLDFGVLDESTSNSTDAERFRVLVYIQLRRMARIGLVSYSSALPRRSTSHLESSQILLPLALNCHPALRSILELSENYTSSPSDPSMYHKCPYPPSMRSLVCSGSTATAGTI